MTSNHSEAATAAVEHEALIKAKTDLDAIQVEFQTLQRAHAQALQEAAQKLQDVEGKAARSEKLEVELAELKKEQEDNANKLSELEVEILELKDSQEAAEDEHSKLLSRSKKLEEELSKAAVATQQAIEDAKVKEEEYARKIQDIGKTYEEELKAASEEQMKLTAKLDVLKSELVDAQDAHEQSRVATDATAVEHTHRLDEAEKAYLHMQSELSEQIRRITVELEVFRMSIIGGLSCLFFCRDKKHNITQRWTRSRQSMNSYCRRRSSVLRSVARD
jgi:uncharacterized protein YhaN